MTAEAVNAWFTPFHYFVYLGTIFVILVAWLQWRWARICQNNIQVLVAEQGGGGKFTLAPKTGGTVSIKNPHTDTVRMWAVNELATIDILYPGVGFIPAFMQKTIRLAIVNEGDWEPMLNRSPHRPKVASPDMVKALMEIAEGAEEKTEKAIIKLLDGVATAPTREMIASPAILGNLIQEKISELAVTVAKDIVNPINEAIKRLGQRLNPTIVYIGLSLVVILSVVSVFFVVGMGNTDVGALAENVDRIMDALGIK